MSTPSLAVTGKAVSKPTASVSRAMKNMLKPVVTADEAWELLEIKISSRYRSVREAFGKFDADADGIISATEMRQALAFMGLEMTTGEFKKFWKGFDTSGDGRISYTEFNNKVGHMVHPTIGYMLKRPDTPKIKEWQRRAIARGLKKKMNNLDDAFREVDADDSGYVSHSEFIQLLRKLGLVKVGNEESYQMMMRAMKPDNKTGQLSFDEFKACMQEYMNIPDELLNMDEEGPKSTNLVAAEKLLQDKLYNKFGQVQKAFRLFDEDKSGELSYDEFRRAMHTLNISLNEEMMMALVAKFDPEHEGAISYENFNAYVGKILHVSAKDESASMLELEKFGGMQDGLTFNPNAHNANKAKDRGFSEGALGSHGPAAHVNLIDGMAEFKDEEEDPTASSISPPPAAPRSVAGSVHAPPAVAVAGRRDSRDSLRAAAAVPEARRASAAGVPYNAAPRVVRANSIATDEFDLAGTEEKMRRVLGRSWVQVFSDVKKASGRAPSLSSDSFRDVMAERGVPLTSREVRALAARYSGGAAGEVDAESLLRNTFKARPGTAAARPSLGRTGAPVPVAAPTAFTRPPTGQATARPSSAFVRAPVGPQVHAATGKMIF